MTYWSGILSSSAILMLLSTALFVRSRERNVKAAPATVATSREGLIAAPGRVEAISEEIRVSSELNGRLHSVPVEEGDHVRDFCIVQGRRLPGVAIERRIGMIDVSSVLGRQVVIELEAAVASRIPACWIDVAVHVEMERPIESPESRVVEKIRAASDVPQSRRLE